MVLEKRIRDIEPISMMRRLREMCIRDRSGTIIMISGSGEYQETLKSLSEFLTIDTVKFNEATVDMSGNALPNHIDIYLGNTFIDEL